MMQCGEDATLHQQATGNGSVVLAQSIIQVATSQKVCAVLVLTRSADGAVRVGGDETKEAQNVVTGPEEEDEQFLVVLEGEQKCHILGRSSYRLVTR